MLGISIMRRGMSAGGGRQRRKSVWHQWHGGGIGRHRKAWRQSGMARLRASRASRHQRASAAWRASIGVKWRKAIITANGNEAAGGVEEIGGEGKWRKAAQNIGDQGASNGSGIKW
jgi:hypothetical protein